GAGAKRREAGRGAAPAIEPLPSMPRGALIAALVVAALCALAGVTTPIYDPDLWQHLLVGKVIWQTHAIPHTQLWTWPTHGAPDVLPSWLLRVALWPFSKPGGVEGLYALPLLTAFVAFGLAYLTARRMGATGVGPLLMIVWGAILWRGRSQMGPEMFAGILLMAQVLLLETRRAAARRPLARDLAWGVVPV